MRATGWMLPGAHGGASAASMAASRPACGVERGGAASAATGLAAHTGQCIGRVVEVEGGLSNHTGSTRTRALLAALVAPRALARRTGNAIARALACRAAACVRAPASPATGA